MYPGQMVEYIVRPALRVPIYWMQRLPMYGIGLFLLMSSGLVHTEYGTVNRLMIPM